MNRETTNPKCTRQQVPFLLSDSEDDANLYPMGHLLQTICTQWSFLEEQCWVFDDKAVDRLAKRYSSAFADSFSFLPAFKGKSLKPDLFRAAIQYLR